MQGNTGSRFVRAAGAFALGGLITLSALADSTSLAPADASATVTDSTAVSMDFSVTRDGDLSYDAYVSYQTADDTAVAGSDYTASSGSVLIPAGASSATVAVPVLGSSTPKSDRAFKLDVLGGVGVGPTPSFGSAASFPVATSGYPQPDSMAVADFNGDGRPDLVTANSNANTVSILLNDTAPGAGSASYVLVATPAVGNLPAAVAVGDFNGDGLPDIAVANLLGNSVSILLNHTAPGASSVSFTLAANLGVGAAPDYVAVSDLNGDGKLDLVVANANGNSISILLNGTAPGAASASFTLVASLPVGSVPTSVAVGDFNGDGLIDLATTNYYDSRVVILLNGTAPGATTVSFTPAGSATVGTFTDTVEAGDFNGDGKLDLAVANLGSNNISILVNTTVPGSDSTHFVPAASPAVPGISNMAVADLNGDGRPDLATVNRTETVSVLLNTTPASAASTRFVSAAAPHAGAGPYYVVPADFNGDGKPDLLSVNANSSSITVLLNGSVPGTDSPDFSYGGGAAVAHDPLSAAVADFNGDGRPDVAAASYANFVVDFYFNGTAPGADTVALPLAGEMPVGAYPQSVAAADFNADGKPDLAVANYGSNNVSILLNNTAAGAATASFTAAASPGTGSAPVFVAAGDFNGDGKPDLAVANYGSGNVALLINTTAPGSASPSFSAVSLPTGVSPYGLAIADLNGDGKPDLAVANRDNSTLSILFNQTAPGATSASFATAATLSVGQPSFVAASDLNGDGKPDLALVTGASSGITILLNDTAVGAATANFSVADTQAIGGSTALAIRDLNGDGRPDLVVLTYIDGDAVILLNQQYTARASGSATGSIHYDIPVASLSPASLDFGSQRVASSSAAKTVQLSNSGSGALSVNSIVVSGDFSQSNNCPASLAPAAQCSIDVVFKPTAAGSRSGALTVASNAQGSPATVSLGGTGIEAVAQFSAASLSFGEQPVGATSTAQTLTLSNPGSATLDIASIMAAGDFAQSNNCGVMLLPGNSCTITVTFTPAVSGARSGTITLISDAASSPDIINLSGTGTAPIAHLSTAALSFGSIYIDSSSTAQSVTLSNTGNGALQIASLVISGDFSKTSDCGTTLAPAASCSINVSFAPLAAGLRSGTLTLSSNAASSPDSVSLSGNGLKHDTQLTVNPALGTLIPPQLYLGASAQLQQTTPTLMPLAGKTVTFTMPSGAFICSGVTDASGKANCRGTLSILGIILGGGYHGSFAGDAMYNGSQGDGSVL